jgi:hypothetical protein
LAAGKSSLSDVFLLDIFVRGVMTATDMPPESTWVPNWKNENQYPHPTNPGMWAWEFLRRNAKYRTLWKKVMLPQMKNKSFIRTDFHLCDVKLQFEQEFAVSDFWPPPPWLSSADLGTKWNYPRFVEAVTVEMGRVGWPVDEEGPYVVENVLDGTEAIAKFDLRFPFTRQLKQVERILRDRIRTLKKDGQLQMFRKQYRFSLYRNYLRLLDGKQAEASLSEMAKAVFPKNLNNKLLVRDSLKAAARLRDYDYRFLAALPRKLQSS